MKDNIYECEGTPTKGLLGFILKYILFQVKWLHWQFGKYNCFLADSLDDNNMKLESSQLL